MSGRPAIHRAYILAELRIRHGSAGNFEKARGLNAHSVQSVLKGKTSTRTAQAIADELGVSIEQIGPQYRESNKVDHSRKGRSPHYDAVVNGKAA